MPHVIVTGGPGAGKTALLSRLAKLGYFTVEDSARAIIAKRVARGDSPRPDLVTFAREILRRAFHSGKRSTPPTQSATNRLRRPFTSMTRSSRGTARVATTCTKCRGSRFGSARNTSSAFSRRAPP